MIGDILFVTEAPWHACVCVTCGHEHKSMGHEVRLRLHVPDDVDPGDLIPSRAPSAWADLPAGDLLAEILDSTLLMERAVRWVRTHSAGPWPDEARIMHLITLGNALIPLCERHPRIGRVQFIAASTTQAASSTQKEPRCHP